MLGIGTIITKSFPRGIVPFLPSNLANQKIWLHPGSGISKNGSDLIDKWTDASGQGNDLLQAVETNKPLWVAGLKNGYAGVRFDGVDNFLKAVNFTWNQPETIYLVFNQVSWTSNDGIFDGSVINGGRLTQLTATPGIRMNAPTFSLPEASFTIGAFHIGTFIFNSINSLLQHNNDAPLLDDIGTNNIGGFTLGAKGNITDWSNIEVMEMAGYSTAHTAEERTQMIDYFSLKYAIAL